MAPPSPRKGHRRVHKIVQYNGRHMYEDLQVELSDRNASLADFDPVWVETAKAWAKKNHKKWPPRLRPENMIVWSTDLIE